MSESQITQIPEYINELPTVRAGRVYNGAGNFVELDNVGRSSLGATLSHNIHLLCNETAGNYRPVNICELTAEEIQHVNEQNKIIAEYSCQQALSERFKSRVAYGISAIAGTASLSFSTVSASKSLTLSTIKSCHQEKTNTNIVIDARCASFDYGQSRVDLKLEAGLSGLGAVILAMAAFNAFRFGAHKSVDAQVHFVKAALSNNNATICDRALKDDVISLDPA